MMLFLLCCWIVSTFKAAEARGLLLQVKSFQFILCLVIFDRVLSCVNGLSDLLQGLGTVETIEAFRSDDEWGKVFR